MIDVIYLTVDQHGVKKMTKSLPYLQKGEFPVKIEVEVKPEAFRNPVLTKKVVVEDWREGIDIQDVDFKETFITPKEAEVIKAQRLERMQEILSKQGYTVIRPEQTESGE